MNGAIAPTRTGMLLTVAYDGTAFHGWAFQRGVRTVEEVVQGAVQAMDPRVSPVRGASRTDAGVHAEGQAVCLDTEKSMPEQAWVLGLNKHLPHDVAVRSARTVPCGFSPRFAACGKRYRYRVLIDDVRAPLLRTRAWRVGWPVDYARMAREAARACGMHDFAAFRSASDQRETTLRTLTRLAIEPEGRLVSVVVEGNAFLHNMVRILVGTLVEVGCGRLPEGTMERAFASGNRRDAGMTAPAHGLVLEEVKFALPEGVGAPWPPVERAL